MTNDILTILRAENKETLVYAVKIYEELFTEHYQTLSDIARLLNVRVNRAEMLSRIKELLVEAEG